MNLSLQNIEKSFGDNHVLKGISLNAESGKAVGILGRNGAGKTTAIRIIMGVFQADSGAILIDGEAINYSKVNIGYLPEERGLYPKKIIIQQLTFFGMLKGMSKKEAIASATYWLERLGMSEHTKKRLDTLSKGNQQKIQLVATLISDPDIIILDEPFSGLDPVNAMLLKDVVKELIAKNKVVLFSSHQMNYIEEFCDEIAILNGGEVVLSGNIERIKRSYHRNKLVVKSLQADKLCEYLAGDYMCEASDNTLTITMESEDDKSSIVKQIADSGLDIDKIEVFEPSLNDIFVEFTEDRI